ncbi:hypothetical protein J132_03887, partial [Termitomyces sp. J132]
FGRLMQCRTKHALIGEYYTRFVPNKSIGCICREWYQTRKHIIQRCPRYKDQEILRGANEQLEMGVLLGTKKGIKAMTRFLEKSSALTKTGKP